MLTDHDVRRIVDGTGKPPKDFVRFFGEGEINMIKRHPFWVRLATRRAVMALRWGRNRCILLDKQDQCTVYEHRPLACREHPFNITVADSGTVTNLALSTIVDCPFELDGQVTKNELRAICKWNEDESEEYQVRVKKWNRRRTSGGTRTDFMEFLGFDWNKGGKNPLHDLSSTDGMPSFA